MASVLNLDTSTAPIELSPDMKKDAISPDENANFIKELDPKGDIEALKAKLENLKVNENADDSVKGVIKAGDVGGGNIKDLLKSADLPVANKDEHIIVDDTKRKDVPAILVVPNSPEEKTAETEHDRDTREPEASTSSAATSESKKTSKQPTPKEGVKESTSGSVSGKKKSTNATRPRAKSSHSVGGTRARQGGKISERLGYNEAPAYYHRERGHQYHDYSMHRMNSSRSYGSDRMMMQRDYFPPPPRGFMGEPMGFGGYNGGHMGRYHNGGHQLNNSYHSRWYDQNLPPFHPRNRLGFQPLGSGGAYSQNNFNHFGRNQYERNSISPPPMLRSNTRGGSIENTERGNGNPSWIETDRYDEVIKSINFHDNGKVINIKATLAPSAMTKLKETSNYHLRVRLPATTPLCVVKRILVSKFYLTKMMSVAKYSTDRNTEFFQDDGSVFMENSQRNNGARVDLLESVNLSDISLRSANFPNVFLSDSETLHNMLYRQPQLQRPTPKGGEVYFLLR